MPRRITKAPKRAIEPSAIPPTVSPYLTTAEVAQHLRVSVRTVERLHERGALTAYLIAGRGHRRFRADDVERLLVPDHIAEQQDTDLDSFISTHSKRG
jgi:excisionase family DNA binding protein